MKDIKLLNASFPVIDENALDSIQNGLLPEDWEVYDEDSGEISHYTIEDILYTLSRRLSESSESDYHKLSRGEAKDEECVYFVLHMFKEYAKAMGDEVGYDFFDSYFTYGYYPTIDKMKEFTSYYATLATETSFMNLSNYMSTEYGKGYLLKLNDTVSEFADSSRIVDYARNRLVSNPEEVNDWGFDTTQMSTEEATRVIESFNEEVIHTPKTILSNLDKITKIASSFEIEFSELSKRLKELSFEDHRLVINGTELSVSVGFDDIFESTHEKYGKIQYCMNFSYLEVEKSNKSKLRLNREIPSLRRLENKIEFLRSSERGGYIVVGVGGDVTDEDIENDIGLKFNTVEDFKEYVHKYISELKPVFRDFVADVEKYLENAHFEIISDTGIREIRSNGGRKQDVLFKSDNAQYKISVLSESHDFQSYATLYKMTDDGWAVLQKDNPKRDYNVDISSTKDYDKFAFEGIIESLESIAKSFDTPKTKKTKKKTSKIRR